MSPFRTARSHQQRKEAIERPARVVDKVRQLCVQQAHLAVDTSGEGGRAAVPVGPHHDAGTAIRELLYVGAQAGVAVLLEVRGQRGPIVKTVTTSFMLDRLGELYGVPVHEVGVGFKYVAPKMIETDAIIGGEESGAVDQAGFDHCGAERRPGDDRRLFLTPLEIGNDDLRQEAGPGVDAPDVAALNAPNRRLIIAESALYLDPDEGAVSSVRCIPALRAWRRRSAVAGSFRASVPREQVRFLRSEMRR